MNFDENAKAYKYIVKTPAGEQVATGSADTEMIGKIISNYHDFNLVVEIEPIFEN